MIFFNGNIITMTGQQEKPEVTVVENGKIAEVGDARLLKQLQKSKNHRMIDLNGGTLMPSFIDPHSHFTSVATSFLEVSLEEAKSISEILEILSDFIKRENKPKGSWIVAKGYDQNFLKEKRHPTAQELDKAAPENPVILHHISGHMGVFNTKATELLNIDTNSCYEKSGDKFTGYLEEGKFLKYSQRVPIPSAEEMQKAYLKAQKKYASYGITTIQEGMTIDSLIPMYKMLNDTKTLYLDLVCFCGIDGAQEFLKTFESHKGSYENRIKIGGYKIFLDGSPQGRTAWMRKPYSDSKDYFGHSSMSDLQVYSAMKLSAKNNMQLLSHCNGDRAVQQLLQWAEKAESEGYRLKAVRPVIIHGQLMGRDQIKKAKELGFIASFFPVHIYKWGGIHLKNFGRERGENISPAGSAEKEGLVYTFHQDSPVTEPDMLKTIWCASARKSDTGLVLGRDERISPFCAVKAVTSNAAYQYFEEKEKGTIEKGKKADLIILDKDPLSCEEDAIPKIKVLSTFKEGKLVYSLNNP